MMVSDMNNPGCVVYPDDSVEGGELFERIVDETSPLTEVDAMVYVKQICEGVQYMHHMYVLHLDLKVPISISK